jgi:hypothetical protein
VEGSGSDFVKDIAGIMWDYLKIPGASIVSFK